MKKPNPSMHELEKSNAEWYFNTQLHYECFQCRDRLRESDFKVVRGMTDCPRCGHALFWKRLSKMQINENKKELERRLNRKRREELAKQAMDNSIYRKWGTK